MDPTVDAVSPAPRSRDRSRVALAVALAAGLALSATLFAVVRTWEDRLATSEFERRAADAASNNRLLSPKRHPCISCVLMPTILPEPAVKRRAMGPRSVRRSVMHAKMVPVSVAATVINLLWHRQRAQLQLRKLGAMIPARVEVEKSLRNVTGRGVSLLLTNKRVIDG